MSTPYDDEIRFEVSDDGSVTAYIDSQRVMAIGLDHDQALRRLHHALAVRSEKRQRALAELTADAQELGAFLPGDDRRLR